MSNPNPPNKFKKGEPRPAGAGRRPGAVNHLTTARVKTEPKYPPFCNDTPSTRLHRSVIRAGDEFENRMNHLAASWPVRNDDSGY